MEAVVDWRDQAPTGRKAANDEPAQQADGTAQVEFDDGVLRITRTLHPPGLRVEGEVDVTTLAAFTKALASAAERGGDVYVDLGGLTFIDLGGLRTLVATARALDGGRTLVLHPLRPHLRRLIRLVGWDDTPGLRLGGDPR